jgi:hypothetical protein
MKDDLMLQPCREEPGGGRTTPTKDHILIREVIWNEQKAGERVREGARSADGDSGRLD